VSSSVAQSRCLAPRRSIHTRGHMNVAAGLPPPTLVRKLSRFLRLSRRDVAALADLTNRVRRLPARTSIVAEGDVPQSAFVLVDGMACRFRILSDGRRQIMSFIIPGDICDVQAAMLKR